MRKIDTVRAMGHRDNTTILLAEDNEDDALMFRRAATKAKLTNPVHSVKDGEDAIRYLEGTGPYRDRAAYPLPGLVLLDLKMPRKDGFEVLEWIRAQPQLAMLQVVVLSSSDEIADINRAYSLGANSFLVKPLSFDEFVGMVEALRSYCLRVWQTSRKLHQGAPRTVALSA